MLQPLQGARVGVKQPKARNAHRDDADLKPKHRTAAYQTRAPPGSVRTDGLSSLRYKILTAREATIAIAISETTAWRVMRLFAQAVSGYVSVGLNAVELVNAT